MKHNYSVSKPSYIFTYTCIGQWLAFYGSSGIRKLPFGRRGKWISEIRVKMKFVTNSISIFVPPSFFGWGFLSYLYRYLCLSLWMYVYFSTCLPVRLLCYHRGRVGMAGAFHSHMYTHIHMLVCTSVWSIISCGVVRKWRLVFTSIEARTAVVSSGRQCGGLGLGSLMCTVHFTL